MKVYLFSLPILFVCMGCTSSFNVGVNGYSSTGQSLSIPEGSSFAVVTDSNVPNPIFQKEVGTKIRKMLTNMGYADKTEQPDYYLLFKYGIDSGRSVTDVFPIYHHNYYYDYWCPPYYDYGYTTYLPYSSVIYSRWLVLKLFDRKTYTESRKAEPLWICEVGSAGTSSDLREIINYMLIAAFDHFGQDTGRQFTEVIPRKDERVRALAGY